MALWACFDVHDPDGEVREHVEALVKWREWMTGAIPVPDTVPGSPRDRECPREPLEALMEALRSRGAWDDCPIAFMDAAVAAGIIDDGEAW